MSERKEKDLVSDLLEKEWTKRVDEVTKTGILKPNDIVVFGCLKLNYEMATLAEEMAKIRQDMVTKSDFKWWLGVGLTVATAIITLVSKFI